MHKQTQLYAQYTDQNYGNGETIVVSDLQDAVHFGLVTGAPRFKMFEQTVAEIDGETLKGEPKNHSANIYLGVDQVYSRDQVIDIRNKELEEERAKTLQDDFSQAMSVQSLRNLIGHLYQKDQSTRFIPEHGQRGGFIELDEGEMVFNRQGEQLHPKPKENGFVKIHYPASDAPEV